MIDVATARERVSNFLGLMQVSMNSFGSALPGYKNPNHELVILGEQEYEFGWVFVYATKKFVETRDVKHMLAGNAPLIVDRDDGQIYLTGTAHELEHYIDKYRKGIRHPVKKHA